jgi:signal transduction histidine kinase
LAVFALSLAAGAWFFSKTQVYNLRLNKKKQQLEELNETKDKLFGIIGHDLRASAVNLDSTLILLEQKNSDQQQLADHIATLRKKVTAHQTILNNLLYWALSQRQVLWANPRLISLKVNIDETLDSLRGLMQEKALHTQWTAISADTVYADENHLQIVLYNLIHNAIKFSPYGGGIQLSITKNSGTAVLSITNKGEEFEWGGTDKIWVLKQSTRGTSGEKGTGLGLLVCAELIKLNKGSIRAYSNVETTTLELIFPLMQASNDV